MRSKTGLRALDDDALAAKTPSFREQLAAGASLEDILPEAFAVVREASSRNLGLRHFDVQIVGGLVLHQGGIAEMKTGEGKTLVATLPAYLNALLGRGVHIVTVNDYLARRDAEWMGAIFGALGLTTGVVVPDLQEAERRTAYAADVTYGTNNEFGFDYLRDNMKMSLSAMVQRGHHFGIVDEVDSILIDEARTPLIISGPTDDRTQLYTVVDALAPELKEDHYEIDEKPPDSPSDRGWKRLRRAVPAGAECSGGGKPVRCGKRHRRPSCQSGPQGPQALSARAGTISFAMAVW